MRYKSLATIVAAALTLAVPTAAAAQSTSTFEGTKSAADKWEVGFLALSALDAGLTINCLNRKTCTEGNPIWGHHPSTGKIILTKVGLGLVHFTVFKIIERDDPKTALRAAQVSAAVQGGIVLLNARLSFR